MALTYEMPMNPSTSDHTQPGINDDQNMTDGYPPISTTSYSTTTDIDDQKNQNILASFTRTEVSAGPLPHPELLKAYDMIIKNGAERIMRMAEKEQENRFEERRDIRKANKEISSDKLKIMKRGQIFGFILSLVILGLATLFVFTGHEVVSYGLFTIGAASLVGIFVSNSHESRKSTK